MGIIDPAAHRLTTFGKTRPSIACSGSLNVAARPGMAVTTTMAFAMAWMQNQRCAVWRAIAKSATAKMAMQ